ncbi:MAG: peptidylprolyl isomerase [Methyloceanibacter sp.]|nr:peptidylprolyl isomerase [Methyloceanibacter sp.]
MTFRTIVLSAVTLLLAIITGYAPASAQNLGDPSSLNARAPDTFKAKFDTSKGTFVVQVERFWAPNGADRFYNLVKAGFYNDARFFRVIDGFMVQFGISGNPDVSAAWTNATIPDDPVRESNARGTVTFATAGPNTRTTQVFINFNNNAGLNGQGFAPFGKVVSGMDVVDSLFNGYGEGAPRGNGPNQGLIKAQGNAYLVTQFPKLDYIKKATIE